MRTYIKVDTSLRRDLMKIFDLSRKGVWMALNGVINSEKANQLRRYALANGGQYVREEFVPDCKTVHDEDGGFTQEFGGGVSVRVNTVDSTATISVREQVVERFGQVTLSMWSNILRLAQAYADGNAEKIAN